MENGGNAKVNAIFEAHLNGVGKPSAGANGPTRERFIRDKYERRKFFDANVLQQYDNGEMSGHTTVTAEEESKDDKSHTGVPLKMRAPSDAAKIRAENRRSRVSSTRAKVDKTTNAPPSNTVVDLLDFGSVSEPAPQFNVFAAMQQQQQENNFANFSDPFDIEASNSGNSVEVTVKKETRVSTAATTVTVTHPPPQSASTTTSASITSQLKAKPALSSDEIMKLFNQPSQMQNGFGLMTGGTANGSFQMMNPSMMGMMSPTSNNANATMMLQQDTNSKTAMNGVGSGMSIHQQQQVMMQQQLFLMQQQSMSMMTKQMNISSSTTTTTANNSSAASQPGGTPSGFGSTRNMDFNQHLPVGMGIHENNIGSMAPMGGATNYSGGLNISQLNLMNRLQMGNMSMGSMVPNQEQKGSRQPKYDQFGSLNLFGS